MNACKSPQDELNARTYFRGDVAQSYMDERLTRVEAMLLLRNQPAFAGKDVLDIGVGTGRTSIYLAPLARRYEGIDYSPSMVRFMQATRPEIPVRLADMRDLGEFSDGSFDFVFAPSNVLDAVGHEDRLHALGEFRRVLRADGTLVFSSHNRLFLQAEAGPRLRWTPLDPVRQLRGIGIFVRQLNNHRRYRTMRSSHGDYALLTDEGHDFALLHYYVGQAEQRAQLERSGFEVLDVSDTEGRILDRGDPARSSASLAYTCRRRPD